MGTAERQPSPADEAKRIILGIIQKSGGSLEGRTRLYKAFYAAHLFYWQKHGLYLTTHPIVCMPNGPGIDGGHNILRRLRQEGIVRVSLRSAGPHMVDVYELVPGATVELEATEAEAIEEALKWIEGKSGTAISEESHAASVTWTEAAERGEYGKSLHIFLDSLSEEELDTKRELAAASKALLDAHIPLKMHL